MICIKDYLYDPGNITNEFYNTPYESKYLLKGEGIDDWKLTMEQLLDGGCLLNGD